MFCKSFKHMGATTFVPDLTQVGGAFFVLMTIDMLILSPEIFLFCFQRISLQNTSGAMVSSWGVGGGGGGGIF